jgi:arylsulfatase A-like enzyme
MLTRRALLQSAAAAPLIPRVLLLTQREPLPGAVVFTRAYAAYPEPKQARASLLAGKFPHALRQGDAELAGILKREGIAFSESGTPGEDTLVIATALDGLAGEVFEASIRVPLSIRYPRKLKPEPAGTPVSLVDVVPTVLSLCGVTAPEGLHGTDLAGPRPESVYLEGALGAADEWRMVIRGFDKLVVNTKFEATHLFNLARDPDEQENLATDGKLARTRDELTAILKYWMRRTSDRVPYPGLRKRR